MSFLSRIKAASGDEVIYIEDIFTNDPQYKRLVDSVISVLEKFASKFNMTDDAMLKLFIKSLEKEI